MRCASWNHNKSATVWRCNKSLYGFSFAHHHSSEHIESAFFSVEFTYFIHTERRKTWIEGGFHMMMQLELPLWFCAFFLASPSAYGWQHSRLNLRSFGSYLWHLLMVFDLLKYLSDRTFFSHYNSGGYSVADYWFCQVCRYHSGSSQVSHFWWLLFPL